MKRILYILVLCLLPILGISQLARINITSGYVKIGYTNFSTLDGPGTNHSKTILVMDDSLITALTASGGAGILSSGEFNMIEWNIGQNPGTYTIPFVSDNHSAIPLYLTVSTHGTNNTIHLNASIAFSTWHTPSDNSTGLQSLTGLPMDVTNMDADFAGEGKPSQTDNSYNVVDRFWVIDDQSSLLPSGAKKYAAGKAPTITLQFSYLGASNGTSEVSAPNAFTDGLLIPQRFNSTQGTWSDYVPATTTDVTGSVSDLTMATLVPSLKWFRSWTLTNSLAPLPIKLISFTAQCQNNQALLQWSTATEVNNDYFTIDKSPDGATFQTLGTVKGAGNSSTTLNYSLIDPSPLFGTSYYRLSQTDFDGNTVIAGTTAFTSCEGENTTLTAYNVNSYINVEINSAETADANYNFTLCNTLGQTVLNETKTVVHGLNDFKLNAADMAEGVYFLTVSDATNTFHKKILLKR